MQLPPSPLSITHLAHIPPPSRLSETNNQVTCLQKLSTLPHNALYFVDNYILYEFLILYIVYLHNLLLTLHSPEFTIYSEQVFEKRKAVNI